MYYRRLVTIKLVKVNTNTQIEFFEQDKASTVQLNYNYIVENIVVFLQTN